MLKNQREIFLEEDLITGLKLCENQYELVSSLPLVGHGVYITRTDASMINPYNLEILSIAVHHKIIDTYSIMQNNNEIEFSLGTGSEKEKVNAVVPLFDFGDKDLTPYVRS